MEVVMKGSVDIVEEIKKIEGILRECTPEKRCERIDSANEMINTFVDVEKIIEDNLC